MLPFSSTTVPFTLGSEIITQDVLTLFVYALISGMIIGGLWGIAKRLRIFP